MVDEWRLKCEDLSTELETSQRDCRNCSSELFRLRAAWDETVEQLDSVRRENKNLADEIKDLLDQLGEGGRSIHELDKQRRRLQVIEGSRGGGHNGVKVLKIQIPNISRFYLTANCRY